MTIIHTKIECILEDFADQQTNLGSKAARKMVADRIVKECISRGKTMLIEEINSINTQLPLVFPVAK
jgi:hypothetical protein